MDKSWVVKEMWYSDGKKDAEIEGRCYAIGGNDPAKYHVDLYIRRSME